MEEQDTDDEEEEEIEISEQQHNQISDEDNEEDEEDYHDYRAGDFINSTKGQLISKANSKLFIWTKKNNKNIFVFLP